MGVGTGLLPAPGWAGAAKVEEARSWGDGIYFCFLKRGTQGPAGRWAAAGASGADILLVAWLGAGFQQGVPGARLLPILGLAGLGVGDPEAGVDAALHVVLRILWGEGW